MTCAVIISAPSLSLYIIFDQLTRKTVGRHDILRMLDTRCHKHNP
jgi:hypothetical protein